MSTTPEPAKPPHAAQREFSANLHMLCNYPKQNNIAPAILEAIDNTQPKEQHHFYTTIL